VGRAAGTALLVCFVTGVVSHVHQHPVGWFDLPSRPVWGYRLTQGLHVAVGIAAIPLVLVKLWIVYPRLFGWPPARTVGHALERLLVLPLVAGTLFELTTGLLNAMQWYPWRFAFPRTHWAVAWVVAGTALVHVAVKAGSGTARNAAAPRGEPTAGGEPAGRVPARRAVLAGLGAGVAAITGATVGQTLPQLDGVSLLAPRRPGTAPQGVPINRTAAQAGVTTSAADPGWRLVVTGGRTVSLTLADLARLPQHEVALPIACVEGWSATGRWGGVRLRDVLDLAGVPAGAHVVLGSLEPAGPYARSTVAPPTARDPLTLLALSLDGAPLTLDHGYPVRLIAPNRPGVLQTKWLARIEVMS
jgi:DMSO/TMAO reductase YedYZ molybdopterin-dependent catalytic subunit